MTDSMTRPEPAEVHAWLRAEEGFAPERVGYADWSRKGRVRVVTDDGWVYVYVFKAGPVAGYGYTLKTDGPMAAIAALVKLAADLVAAEAVPAE